MMPTRQGSIRLFRLAGIDLFLHWSWFLVAVLQIQYRARDYASPFWNVLEYLALFGIVLMHEFGHALACRQVGGGANQIVLWPLGGVAYVSPPQRPGAVLWSIAAGPLVNVALLPVLFGLRLLSQSLGWSDAFPDFAEFLWMLWLINLILLVFNLLPVYPLDGGQILRALLWFVVGRGRSLLVASLIGFLGVLAMAALAVWDRSIWFGILAVFILLNCWRGLQQALMLSRLDRAPRHEGFACPSCGLAPMRGAFWMCGNCRQPMDPFVSHGHCPQCGGQFQMTLCPECRGLFSLHDWMQAKRPG